MEGVLLLEDGSVWKGRGFGAAATVSGEVVFNTGMVGYPESLTDPSYHGQILCQTYPLIGNYGIDPGAFESEKPQVEGYVVSEHCTVPSHASSRESLEEWLRKHGIPGLAEIDTRALTQKLRVRGVMLGLLSTSENALNIPSLRREARKIPDPNLRNLTLEVSSPRLKAYNPGARKTVVVVDCGVKKNIIRCLVRRKVRVVRVPAASSFKDVMGHSPSGVVVSNGPGNPALCRETIQTLRRLIKHKVPLFGICLGNQLLALAARGSTFKLKYGHRSQNQPCLEEGTRRCYITSQNHGYAVDVGKLPRDWRPWFTNANDGTNEGIIHHSGFFRGVQFHPEACPGPVDTEFLFDDFVESLK